MKVNFVDLKTQYLSIKKEIDTAIQKVIDKTAFAAGPFVAEFEKNFAAIHECKYCVGVNSGTSSLHIAMWALGIGDGDEVIVPANTFFATPEAVSLCGANPVFVDCENQYYNIDPQAIEKAITQKTKAVIVVHLYGQPAKMDEIKKITEKHNIQLIEDCSHAHLATYKGKKVGTFGVCGCFSFYPGKNLGAYGEAGAVITNSESLQNRMLMLRDHGSSKKYYHDIIGHNYRMEGIQGAVLNVKLCHLPQWNIQRRKNASLYQKYLKNIEEISLPLEMPETEHVYHLFVIRAKKRDELIEFLKDNEIYTGIHYPIPCHVQKAYQDKNRSLSLHTSEKFAEEILSLPMFPELKEEEIQYVCDTIKEFYHV